MFGKGQNGVGTTGVTAMFMFFDRGTFWGTPVNLLLDSKKFQGVPFSSGPIRVDPICLQPITTHNSIIYYTLCTTMYIHYMHYIHLKHYIHHTYTSYTTHTISYVRVWGLGFAPFVRNQGPLL